MHLLVAGCHECMCVLMHIHAHMYMHVRASICLSKHAYMHACVLHAGVLYPEEISAYVVWQLLEDAARFSGRPVGKAVISVPAYFNDSQREATIAAGKIAGLEAVKLIRCVPGFWRRFGGSAGVPLRSAVIIFQALP